MRNFLVCLIVLSLIACKSSKNLSKVEESVTKFVMPELSSSVNVKYELSKAALQDTFNTIIDYYLAGEMELEAMGMDVVVEKNDDAVILLEGRKVLSSLPIKISVSKNTILSKIKADGILQLDFATEVDIDSSWNLVTKTTLDHYEWTKEPQLSLGAFSIPVGSLANGIIEKSKAEFEKQIDQSGNDQLSIRDKVLDVIKYVEKPIELDTILNSWVTLRPEGVYLSEFRNLEDWFKGDLTVKSKTRITETEPTDVIPGIKLPEYSCRLNFVLDISFDNINEYLNANFKGKSFESKGKSITIHEIDLSRKGKKLVTRAKVSGAVNGDVYVTGTPIFDNAAQTFYADQVDVELKTNNVFHKAGAWLAKGKIKNELKDLLRFSIKDNISAIQEQLNREVERYSVKDELILQADIKDINVNKFVLDDENIHSFVTIHMFLKATIHDMKVFTHDPSPRLLKG